MKKQTIALGVLGWAWAASIFAAPRVAWAHHHKSSLEKGFDHATHEAEHTANQVGHEAEGAVGKTTRLSKSEMGDLRSQADRAFASTAGTFQHGYSAAAAEVQKLVDGMLEKVCRDTGGSFVRGQKQALSQLQAKMKGLDEEGKDALRRVVRAIPSKQVSAQTAQDMRLLASKLGFTEGAFSNGTFGISIGVSGSSQNAEVSGEVGIVMETKPEGGKYHFAFVQSYGAGVGFVQPGVGTEIALTWSPGGLDAVSGPSVGFGGPGVGDMNLAMSWGVPTSLAGVKSVAATPGIAVSLEVPDFWAAEAGPEAEGAQKAPDPAQFAFQGGYALVSNRFAL